MIVRKRKLNTKRHTIGYLVGNQWRTRDEAVSLAKEGRIDGVRISKIGNIEYISSKSGYPSLYNLPTVVKA